MLNIIIPIYREKENLKNCFNSLVAQTTNKFFVTLVQDCDGEDYSTIIDEYRARGLKISLLQNEENVGAGETRQKGIDASTMFDYVMFLDADDMLNPKAVELLYSYAKSKFADVVVSRIKVEKKYYSGAHIECEDSRVWLHGKIYRTQYLKDNDIRFLKGVRANEDVMFNLLALNSSEKVYKLEEETYVWRDNKKSITRSDTVGFVTKYTWQYLQGYSMCALALLNKGFMTKELATGTLKTLYNHAQILIETKGVSHDEDDYIQKLLSTEFFKDILKNDRVLQHIASHTPGGAVIVKKPIFFHESFDEWVNRILGEKIL